MYPEFFFVQNDQPGGQEKVNILALIYSDGFFPSVFQCGAPALYEPIQLGFPHKKPSRFFMI
ncbi:MAG: hypothetical protein WCK53_10385, partial [Methanomicrobiales archaeon]